MKKVEDTTITVSYKLTEEEARLFIKLIGIHSTSSLLASGFTGEEDIILGNIFRNFERKKDA